MRYELNTVLIEKMIIYCHNDRPLCITYSNEVTDLYTDKNEFLIKNKRLCDKNGNSVKYKKNELQYDYVTNTIKCVNTNNYLTIDESGHIDFSQNKIISKSEIFKYEIHRMFLASYNSFSIGISKKGEISHHEAFVFEFKIINGYLSDKNGVKVNYENKFLKFNFDDNTINICNTDQYINIDEYGNIYKDNKMIKSAKFYNSPHLNQLAKTLFQSQFPDYEELHNNKLSSTLVDSKSYFISKKINQWIVNHVVYDLHGSHPHGVSKYIKECLDIHQIQANKTNCIVNCAFNVGAGIHAQYDGLPALRTGVINAIPENYKKELEHTKFLIIVTIRPDDDIGNVYDHDMNKILPSEYEGFIKDKIEDCQKFSNINNRTVKCNFNNFNILDNNLEKINYYIPENFVGKYRKKNNTISVIFEPNSSII